MAACGSTDEAPVDDLPDTSAPRILVLLNEAAIPSSTGTYDFGSRVADGDDGEASAYITFTIENLGDAPLAILDLSVSGSDFDLTEVIEPNIGIAGSTTFGVRFDPLTEAAASATVTIRSSDAATPCYEFMVAGIGTHVPVPEINVRVQNGASLPDGSGSYEFPATLVDGEAGETAPASRFWIENLGSGPLLVSQVSIGAGDFALSPPTTSTILADTHAVFSVVFDPLSIAEHSTTVTIRSNDEDEGIYTFTVTGLGGAPSIAVRQAETAVTPDEGVFSFGNVRPDGDEGDASLHLTFTIDNTGAVPLELYSVTIDSPDFDLIQPALTSVPASGSTEFQVRYDPLSGGTTSARLTIQCNDPEVPAFSFSLVGTATQPQIVVTHETTPATSGVSSYDFGPVDCDGSSGASAGSSAASAYKTFTIANVGDGPLTVASVVLSSTEFDLLPPATDWVGPGNQTTFSIRFDPAFTGPQSGTVTIRSNDPVVGTFTFAVVGTGVAIPRINLRQGFTDIASGSGAYGFGSVNPDGNNGFTSEWVPFSIQNIGGVNLQITGFSIPGSDFDYTGPTPLTVPPGQGALVSIRFDPLTAGTKSVSMTITSNDTYEPIYTVSLRGTGMPAPEINVRQGTTSIPDGPGIYGFGWVTVDGDDGAASAWTTFTIENSGMALLAISGFEVFYNAQHFDVTAPLSTSIAAGATTTFTARFDPLNSGGISGFVRITNNDPDESDYRFTLSGN